MDEKFVRTIRIALKVLSGRISCSDLDISDLELLGYDIYKNRPSTNSILETCENVIADLLINLWY